ncbi:VCBS repeat-containing protein [Bradyrhizobium sp. GM22.5]
MFADVERLNRAAAVIQRVGPGPDLTDTFTVTTVDGTQQIVTVTIDGTNDAAIISGTSSGTVVEAGGVANAIGGTPTVSGTLTDSDVDNAANTFTVAAAGSATDHGYGSYEMTAAGTWTYTLNNSSGAAALVVSSVHVGEHLTDTFTVTDAIANGKSCAEQFPHLLRDRRRKRNGVSHDGFADLDRLSRGACNWCRLDIVSDKLNLFT